MFKSVVIALVAAAGPLAAAPIDDVNAALRATTTMTADFAQTAANGTVQRGKLLLQRPGRIRFQYDRAPLLIVADGKRLSFVDYEVAQVSQWPIRSTPLGILLDAQADLNRFARVVSTDARSVQVEARDPKRPDYGAITLDFARDPSAPGGLALLGWVSLDAQNNRTEIRLTNQRYNLGLPKTSFTFRDPRTRGRALRAG